jgi:hypothetical protein
MIRAAPGRRNSDATDRRRFQLPDPARRAGNGDAVTALRFE